MTAASYCRPTSEQAQQKNARANKSPMKYAAKSTVILNIKAAMTTAITIKWIDLIMQ
jgi:hypothetical protein